MVRTLWLVLILTLGGCAPRGLSSPQPNTSSLRYLTRGTPAAAIDSVEAWAATVPELAVDRGGPGGLVLYDVREGQNNTATVDARSYDGAHSEVVVQARYVASPGPASFRDLPTALFLGLSSRGQSLFSLPAEPSASCSSLDEWRGRPSAAPESEKRVQKERPPELIGGMGGLQRRVNYPEVMRRAGVEGTVLASFIVGTEGVVECAEVVTTPHPELSSAALEAVRASRFVPGTRNGDPVRVRFIAPITFRLQ